MVEYVTCGFLETLGRTGAEQGVQQDVVGLESGVGFEFATPVAFFVLLREEKFAGRIDANRDPAAQAQRPDLRESNRPLRLHSGARWGRGNGFHDFRRQSETDVLRHDLQFLDIVETLGPQVPDHFFHQMLRSRSPRG